MPMDKVHKKKVKVVATSASTGKKLEKKKTTLDEWKREEAVKNKAEKDAKAKIVAEAKAKEDAAAQVAAKLLTQKDMDVLDLTGDEMPKAISACIARTLNIAGGEELLPKDVLEQAALKMPEVKVGPVQGSGPAAIKSKLMVYAKVLAESKRETKEKARINEEKKAAEKAVEEAALQKEREVAAALKAEEAAEEAKKVEEKLEAARAAMAERTPEEIAAFEAKKAAAAAGGPSKKDDDRAKKAQARLSAEVKAENDAVNAELTIAARKAAAARMDGR